MATFTAVAQSTPGRVTLYFTALENPANTYSLFEVDVYWNNTYQRSESWSETLTGSASYGSFDYPHGMTLRFEGYATRNGQKYYVGSSTVTTGGSPIPIPSTPSYLSVSNVSETGFNIDWGTSSNAESYYIYFDDSLISYTSYTSFRVNRSLTAGVSYSVCVSAVNITGESSKRCSSVSFTIPPPSAPSITLSNKTTSSATLALYSAGATYYSMEYKLSTSGTWIVWSSYDYSPVTVTGLQSGKVYDFRAKAYNAGGYGGYSTTLSVSIGAARPTNWSWNYAIYSGGPFYSTSGLTAYLMTATHWNEFTARINAFREYKGLSFYWFTTATNALSPANVRVCVNQAVIAINEMLPTGKMANVVAGTTIAASIFIDLRDKLNSIL